MIRADRDNKEMRWSIHEAMVMARGAIKEVAEEFRRAFGRYHGDLVWRYETEDADILIVATGTLASEAEEAVDLLRSGGKDVGLVKVRSYRPFPEEEIVRLAEGRKAIVVLDRSISPGQAGPLATDVRAALFTAGVSTPVVGFVTGLGGRDITYEDIAEIVRIAEEQVKEGRIRPVEWYKLRR